MYRIYADQWLLHDDNLEELKVVNPQLVLEVNKTGSLSFSIYPDHPYYSNIAKLKTIITVYQDNLLKFRGRVLNDEVGFWNEKQVSCEGELAFLLDSIIRPYDFTGSVLEYFTMLIDNHNSQVEEAKQFVVGQVTVIDPNDYIVRSNINHVNTWDELNDKLLNSGGFLKLRHENSLTYIDYLANFNEISTQTVEFGENLLDIKKVRKGEEIATALIPLGAKLKDEEDRDTDIRLTIETVNGGLDYIFDQSAVDRFGWIFQTVIFEDVTEPQNLLTKAKAYLGTLVNIVESIELSAADLAKLDATVDTFHLGTYVRVKSKPHGIDQLFLVSKIDERLLEPSANKLTLGGTFQGLGEALQGVSSQQGQILQSVEKVAENVNQAVYNVEQNLLATIDVAAENITQSVSERVYLKDETDSLISEVSSTLEQTAAGWEMQFTQFSADMEDLAAGTDAEFELLQRYIRFVDGTILLGEVGNQLQLQISNDRISFIQDSAEVAYLSNNKLYITDAQFLNSLQLGKFAFMPRANGNLSFKAVG